MRKGHAQHGEHTGRQRDSKGSAHEAKNQRLGEKLGEKPGTASAKRLANGNLAAAGFGAGEQEVSDVDAGDQEHEYNGAEEDEHCAAHAFDDFVLETGERYAAAVHRSHE